MQRAKVSVSRERAARAVGRHRILRLSAILFAAPVTARTAFSAGEKQSKEDHMPTFILSLSWTDQGIRNVKDAPKRSKAAQELAKKMGVEIKQLFLTSGDSDFIVIVEAPSGDNVAKFALATGTLGNVRTRTVRAWTEPEFHKLLSELP
jgi:uncharacterized protein with GYD domain